jgi:polar amino acid transport system ATP-binding protein
MIPFVVEGECRISRTRIALMFWRPSSAAVHEAADHVFDEPNSTLNPERINEVLEIMITPAREGMTMVVTHEMGFARKVAAEVVFMDAGAIVEVMESQTFLTSPHNPRSQFFLKQILTPATR